MFRAVAILSVMAYHYLVRWAPPENTPALYNYAWHPSHGLAVGKYGVEIFFVISGLVITMTVLRASSVLDFAVRRFARLWPPLLVATTITFIVTTMMGPPEFKRSIPDALGSLTFIAADLGLRPVDGAYWSLAVEVKFYCLVALSFALCKHRFWLGPLSVGCISAVATVVGKGENILLAAYWPYLLLGMALWYALFERKPWPASTLGAASAALFALNNPGLAASSFIFAAVATMVAMIELKVNVPVLPWIGRISYSVYLIHQNLGVLVIRETKLFGAPDILALIGASVASLALGALMYHGIELPAQRAVVRLFQVMRVRIARQSRGPAAEEAVTTSKEESPIRVS